MLTVDSEGWVYLDGYRLPFRYDCESRTLEFCDKDHRRSAARGTRYVELPADELTDFLQRPGGNVEVELREGQGAAGFTAAARGDVDVRLKG